jgi:hypothetical protein
MWNGQMLAMLLLVLSQKRRRMAKQKFPPTRLGGFSGAKAYIRYVEVLKKYRNAVGRTFCDAILFNVRKNLYTSQKADDPTTDR